MPSNNSSEPLNRPPVGLRQRATFPLIIVAAIFIIVPFFAWYGTWFGRDLSDDKITEYLSDEKNSRHIQHALAQIAERIEKKDTGTRRWYPQVVALSNSSLTELRSDTAWVMGKDNQSQEFHTALQRLVADREPIVQRNAATALVAFGDNGGLAVLRSMLRPYSFTAPSNGKVKSVLREGLPVKVGMMLARMEQNDEQVIELRSPLPGEIQKVISPVETNVKAGDTLILIAPDSATVWEALRALYFVGEREDLSVIEPYTQGVAKMTDEIKQQAALTFKAIQNRSEKVR